MRAPQLWYWKVQGRYGYYGVDKYSRTDDANGTYGDPINLRTRKDAEKVAAALNAAFDAGRQYQANQQDIPEDFPVRPVLEGTKGSATCYECGRSWDDTIATAWTPAPGARCPFEPFHYTRP